MPLHVNVDMNNGHVVNNWVDSLSAYFPGLLVGGGREDQCHGLFFFFLKHSVRQCHLFAHTPQALYGDLKHAMILIEVYISIWRKHGALPERFNWRLKVCG